MGEAGYSIMLVGHSLGAGAAALMAMMYKRGGISHLSCYAFATPNCVSLSLAEGCDDYVTSVVFRDDIIARFSPEALAGLHRQLLDFDLATALQKVPFALHLHVLTSSLLISGPPIRRKGFKRTWQISTYSCWTKQKSRLVPSGFCPFHESEYSTVPPPGECMVQSNFDKR
jgi:hypothetical protein